MFIYLIVMLICFIASFFGTICGIGGGVIIKPVLDSLGIMSISTSSFLSGLTVLNMSAYSANKAIWAKESTIKLKVGIPISIGAIIGGIIGKYVFTALKSCFSNTEYIGSVQAMCLLILTFGTFIYTIKKHSIHRLHIESMIICIIIGGFLGFFSAFLGIGGGPFNLVILSFLFSMETKEAAQNSLYIIMFSQVASLCFTILSRQVPTFNIYFLLGMSCMGVFGAVMGRKVNMRIDSAIVDKLFMGMNIVIMGICIYNI
jgi:Predicted permeases